LIEPSWFVKLFVIVVFIAIANPLSSHALARASYRRGLKPYFKKKTDAYEDAVQQETLKKEEV
jgi:multicomponent Na+:H+ antiporter subunit G